MSKLTEAEQKHLDWLVTQRNHYRQSFRDIRLLSYANDSIILKILREHSLNGFKTLDGRYVNLSGDIVRIDRHPRKIIRRHPETHSHKPTQ